MGEGGYFKLGQGLSEVVTFIFRDKQKEKQLQSL